MSELKEGDRRELRRYLGSPRPEDPMPPEIERLMDRCFDRAQSAARPRSVVSVLLPLERRGEGLLAGPLRLEGRVIAAHLEHCTHAVLLGATLGAPLDSLLRQTEVLDMAEAVVLDACANLLVEREADRAEEALRLRLKGQGLYLTGRFSPGYGDFPLTVQRELLRLLDGPGRIGLTVSSSFVMNPRKSITAVLGAAEIPVTGRRAGCASCLMRDKCVYRKRGTTCE